MRGAAASASPGCSDPEAMPLTCSPCSPLRSAATGGVGPAVAARPVAIAARPIAKAAIPPVASPPAPIAAVAAPAIAIAQTPGAAQSSPPPPARAPVRR